LCSSDLLQASQQQPTQAVDAMHAPACVGCRSAGADSATDSGDDADEPDSSSLASQPDGAVFEYEPADVCVHHGRPLSCPLLVYRTYPATGKPREPWVEIRQSGVAGAGLGVFAKRAFQEGDFVGVYVGQALSACVGVSDYIKELPNRQHPFDALIWLGGFVVDGKQPPLAPPCTPASRSAPLWLTKPQRAPYPGMFAHLINSCSWRGNHTPANVTVWRGDAMVEALVNIAPGQELVWQYEL
jgi:hypothetical protein